MLPSGEGFCLEFAAECVEFGFESVTDVVRDFEEYVYGKQTLAGVVVHGVAARIARQAILEREDPPVLWVVIDDAALNRCVGSPEVTRDALGHLADLARHPNITVQVLADAGRACWSHQCVHDR
jgi:hypothetical protein